MSEDERLTAARLALEAGRWAEARDLFEGVLDESDAPSAHDGLGTALWWLGEVRGGLRHRERAYAGYRAAGLEARATMVAIDICVTHLSNLDNASAARGWLGRAHRAAIASADPGLEPWIWLMEGYMAADPGDQDRLLSQALEAARARSDVDLELVALADLGLARVAGGAVEDGFRLLDEAMAGTLGGEFRRLETVVWASCSMLAACSRVADLKRAAEWCGEADTFSERYGCPFLQAQCRSHYGRVLAATGRWERAEDELTRAVAMSADLGRGHRVEALIGLALLRLRRGDAAAAESLLADTGGGADADLVTAQVLVARGHADRAVAVLEAQCAELTEHDLAYPAVLATLVEAHLARGDLPAAERVAARLGRVAAHQHPQAEALSARAAGLVAAAAGRSESAARGLRSAAQGFRALDLPFEAAQTRLELAAALAVPNPELAVVEASRAQDGLERLGARREALRAAELLRSLGVPTRPGPRRAGLLSVREREVLALLPEGLTNPEIASRLFLSPRTVAHHVSSILAKLGVSTRTEAAAMAARQQGDGPTAP
ncbi:MAG: LuxR C-terminal-related transcriptional regulator [Nocardioides sp.]